MLTKASKSEEEEEEFQLHNKRDFSDSNDDSQRRFGFFHDQTLYLHNYDYIDSLSASSADTSKRDLIEVRSGWTIDVL